jgi:hypothetical protein
MAEAGDDALWMGHRLAELLLRPEEGDADAGGPLLAEWEAGLLTIAGGWRTMTRVEGGGDALSAWRQYRRHPRVP